MEKNDERVIAAATLTSIGVGASAVGASAYPDVICFTLMVTFCVIGIVLAIPVVALAIRELIKFIKR